MPSIVETARAFYLTSVDAGQIVASLESIRLRMVSEKPNRDA